MKRPLCIHHCTSEPFQFFGRTAELALLDEALHGHELSLLAMVGPGGQGKTAIVQTWLEKFRQGQLQADGVFFWSFYRGKDADLCLREMYRYAIGANQVPEVSASYCVDHLLPVLRRERWAVMLDGTEVVQHETGSWYGRFLHPELGRLLEELASAPAPGVAVVTTRFPLPALERRRHARILSLSSLDRDSAVALMRSLGVHSPLVPKLQLGNEKRLHKAAALAGCHAKAVELLATYLMEFHGGDIQGIGSLPVEENTGETPVLRQGVGDEETKVWRVLTAFQQALSQELQDILALATAFRHPPTEERLLQYLHSEPVHVMLHQTWRREYIPFVQRNAGWLEEQIQKLVSLRLLERVHSGHAESDAGLVIDTHPLVRRGFEHVLGHQGQKQSSRARAGFLSGRPDRRPPNSLEEAREEVELFHAFCDAGMWNEADSVFVALDNPKHRFLAPAFERDLLLRFFPPARSQALRSQAGAWEREKPLWPGFGRFRSLAICFELLGQFEEALQTYREADAPLRGDALIALGRLQPLLAVPHVSQPWQNLWQAYRAHALCLAGKTHEAIAVARTLIPVDVYEWVHVFECLLRTGHLEAVDLKSMLYRPPHSDEHRWSRLARQRMRLDYLRLTNPDQENLETEFHQVIEEYDRGGLPFERTLARLSLARVFMARKENERAVMVLRSARELAKRHDMKILAVDAWELLAGVESSAENEARQEIQRLRAEAGYEGATRP